jgi:hypothetical protein
MVSLKFALTKEDYVNYFTYLRWDFPGNKKKRLLYYAKQLIPIIIFFSAFYYTGLFARPGKFILLIAGFMLITTLLSFIGIKSNTIKQAQKIAEDPENENIFLEATTVFSESGITTKNEMLETRIQWKGIQKKLENKSYYYLFINAMQAIIIPKRVFASAEEKLQFEKILTQYLSFDADVSHLLKG